MKNAEDEVRVEIEIEGERILDHPHWWPGLLEPCDRVLKPWWGGGQIFAILANVAQKSKRERAFKRKELLQVIGRELPSLIFGRSGHACASYWLAADNLVGKKPPQ